jgi:hypothetical protein
MISVMISGTVSGTIRPAKLNLLFVLAMGAVSISTGCASEPAPPTKAAVAVNKDLGDNDSVDQASNQDADADVASDGQGGCDSQVSGDSAALALSDSSLDANAACDTSTAAPSKVKTGVPAAVPTLVSAPSPLPPSSNSFPGSNSTGSLASSNPLGGAGGGLGSLLGGAGGGLGSLLGGLGGAGGAGGGLGSLLGGAGGLGGLLGGLGGAPTGSP